MEIGERIVKLNVLIWNEIYNRKWCVVESKITTIRWKITDEILWDEVDKILLSVAATIEKEYENR